MFWILDGFGLDQYLQYFRRLLPLLYTVSLHHPAAGQGPLPTTSSSFRSLSALEGTPSRAGSKELKVCVVCSTEHVHSLHFNIFINLAQSNSWVNLLSIDSKDCDYDIMKRPRPLYVENTVRVRSETGRRAGPVYAREFSMLSSTTRCHWSLNTLTDRSSHLCWL